MCFTIVSTSDNGFQQELRNHTLLLVNGFIKQNTTTSIIMTHKSGKKKGEKFRMLLMRSQTLYRKIKLSEVQFQSNYEYERKKLIKIIISKSDEPGRGGKISLS